ncbi:SusD family protein [Chitinophaga eiseniae]|uniref:SusD family protein n=1 Tax=Chitinophaga eiseniae TaxID=634771 RepID=A0A1T4MLZ3_9BACT|nr:RagB/SusD family nutrient uptake outer membrane protein [Chitinophaga eiseniae]SJZ68012.1 SusD family protein [Chitinophaga eiseniae]
MRCIKLIIALCLVLSLLIFLISCSKYLDAKPDKKMVVPATLQDLQAMMDDVATMNLSWPIAGEVAADNYYLPYDSWASLAIVTDKENYIWKSDVSNDMDWSTAYRVVFKTNVVLETLDNIIPSSGQAAQWRAIKGAALFYRSFVFFMIAQQFAPPYDPASATTDAGIPLRLAADINEASTRATVAQTYGKIVEDLEAAAELLPASVPYKTRPGKAAAFALLSRVHLNMNDYTKAGGFADSCIEAGAQLLDYRSLSPAADEPFVRFNAEVIFHCAANYSYALAPATCKVDTALYSLYDNGDLRRQLFFRENADGSAGFRGNYDGSNSYQLFTGLATDEVFLTLAECHVRQGRVSTALKVLNSFLANRYSTAAFQPASGTDATQVLLRILQERRKELPFRAIRWSDLRRLNKNPQTAITITRQLNGQQYTLPPNDLRYTLQIPNSVLNTASISKNPR